MGTTDPRVPPTPIPPLDFEGERNLLFGALTRANRSLRVFTSHGTTAQLLRLLTVGCRVLHYSGHGMATCLAFESDAGDMQRVDATTLHSMMTAGRSVEGGGVQLAFVSACHSESTADAFLTAGVRHVIAVRSDQQIHDQAAQKFMSMFYYCLLVGKTVRDAFDFAKVSVLASPVNGAVEDGKFLLLPTDGDHEVSIFGLDIASGVWVDCSEEETPNNLQGLPDSFIARNAEMQEIVQKMVKRKKKLLTLTGGVGVGKVTRQPHHPRTLRAILHTTRSLTPSCLSFSLCFHSLADRLSHRRCHVHLQASSVRWSVPRGPASTDDPPLCYPRYPLQ